MRHLLPLMCATFLLAESSFITPMEYASSLYKNPRGIGCNKCHGEFGEGRVIARYKHKGKEKSFVGPSLQNITFEKFYKVLRGRNKGMPRYYLTKKEIEALYMYIQKMKETQKDAHKN